MTMTVYIRDETKAAGRVSILGHGLGRYYRARVTDAWWRRHDNGAMISCGLTVDEVNSRGRKWLSSAGLERLRGQGRLTEVTREQWNHSGCQSSCVLRGGKRCQW
jgi:hypothetical protein